MPSSPHTPRKTSSTKIVLPSKKGSWDGTQLEMKEHISVHAYLLFGLPVKIQESLWRCVFLVTWIKGLYSLATATTL